MKKMTLVLGASPDETRISNRAVRLLKQHGHPVVAVGQKNGTIDGVIIQHQLPESLAIDTITLYINPKVQETYETALLALKPERIIFNPGTENPSFQHRAEAAGIATENACTLVLLQTGQY